MNTRRSVLYAPPAAPAAPPHPLPANTVALGDAELPRLRQQLIRYARMAVRDPGLAEDLVQDTLIAVVESYGTRRGDASLSTWSTAILKHKIADWYRSPARRRMVQFGDEDPGPRHVDAGLYDAHGSYVNPIPAWQQPENQVERRQMMQVLEHCVGCLSDQAGHVFMMREWLGLETTEICQRLGVTAENCRTILHRARMALRICMERDWVGKHP